jgi:hypothetical protein
MATKQQLTVYVEGGGDGKDLRIKARQGFHQFLQKTSLKGRLPKIKASGSRENAYRDFCIAINNNEPAMLLVDSEHPVEQGDSAWQHLNRYDHWRPPPNAHEEDCHMMVVCMEAWLLADPGVLQAYYGKAVNPNALPSQHRDLETVQAPVQLLDQALAQTKYNKSRDAFELLGRIHPTTLRQRAYWADRWLTELDHRL